MSFYSIERHMKGVRNNDLWIGEGYSQTFLQVAGLNNVMAELQNEIVVHHNQQSGRGYNNTDNNSHTETCDVKRHQ